MFLRICATDLKLKQYISNPKRCRIIVEKFVFLGFQIADFLVNISWVIVDVGNFLCHQPVLRFNLSFL